MKFERTPHAFVPPDLRVLQADVGGQIGKLSFDGGLEVGNVLRVDESHYVTLDKPGDLPETLARMNGAYLKSLAKPADSFEFSYRYKGLKNG